MRAWVFMVVTTFVGLVFLLVTGGCVPSPIVRHPGASGRDVVTIRCNYMGRSEGDCFADADRECPDGWDVIRNEQRGAAGMVTLTVRCS